MHKNHSMHNISRYIILLTVALTLLVLSIGSASAAVGDGACITTTEAKTLPAICGSVPIGSAPGYGGIELCGDCYVCGANDGVCPEDYGANCGQCPDPDCYVIITGTVTDAKTGNTVSNANISTVIPHGTQVSTLTDYNGKYSITVSPGDYKIRATHPEYDTNVQSFPDGGDTRTLDFTMVQGACSLDPAFTCARNTNYGFICDERCYGTGTCAAQAGTYPKTDGGSITFDLVKNCSNELLGPGQTVFLGNINSTYQLRGSCCNGGVQAVLRPKVNIKFDSDVSDLHQQAIPGVIKNRQGTTQGIGLLKVYLYSKN